MQGGHGRPPPGWPGNPARTQPQYAQPQPHGQPQQPQPYAHTQPQYGQPQPAQPQPQPAQPQYAPPAHGPYAPPAQATQIQYGQPAQATQIQYGQPATQPYVPPQGFPPVTPADAPASLSGPQRALSREEAQKVTGSLVQDHRGSIPMQSVVWTAWAGSAVIAMAVGFSLVENFFDGAKMAAGSAALGGLIGCAALGKRQRWGAYLLMLANVALLAIAGFVGRSDAAFVMIVWILALGALIAPRWEALL
jgi:hypothetical protein